VLIFLIVGGLGLLMLLAGLLLGDLVDGGLDALGVGDGVVPALGAALAAFGLFGGLLVGPAGMTLAVLGGLAGAAVLGLVALRLARVLIGGDAPAVRTTDLLGVFGTVVTRIPPGGLGEVVLPQAGSRVKLSARSSGPVPAGTPVYVTEVLSATSVVVQRADSGTTDLQELI
jgi:hypothetical protein